MRLDAHARDRRIAPSRSGHAPVGDGTARDRVTADGALRTACRATHTQCRDPTAAPSLTAAARSNCAPPAATGCTEAIMLAHGFSVEQMVELVNTELATATGRSAWSRADARWRSRRCASPRRDGGRAPR